MIDWLVIAAVTAVGSLLGSGIVSLFWHDIKDKVAAWLRQKGLQESDLMDAWVKLDSFVTTVRCKIFVKTKTKGVQIVSETQCSISEIDDPDVLKELQARGLSQRNIMTLMQ